MFNIKINKKEFLQQIQVVENAIEKDNAENVQTGIFLETYNNRLFLKAMGKDMFIKADNECIVLSEGRVIVQYKLIEPFLKELDEEVIELKEEGGRLKIICNNIGSEFAIFAPVEIREPYVDNDAINYEFDRIKLLNNIDKVKFAAAKNADKLSVNCVRLEIEENKAKFIASDSYRLVYLEDELDNNEISKDIKISIPLKTIDALQKIMNIIDEEKVLFKTDGNKILFKFSTIEIITKIIEIPFPDYKPLLGENSKQKTVLVNTKDFLSLLKRTFIFVRDKQNIKNSAIFNFNNNKIEILGLNEHAQITESINTIYDGDPLRISMNVLFLIDYIKNLDNDKLLEIKLINEKSPVILKTQNIDSSLYLTMPISM